VRVVETLAHLHRDEARLRDRHRLALLTATFEDQTEITPMDVLQRDEVRAVDDAEIEDLRDVRVVQLNRDLRLVDEHRDELLVLSDVGKDALHCEEALEAFHAVGLRAEDLRHSTYIDSLKQVVLTERDRLLHLAGL